MLCTVPRRGIVCQEPMADIKSIPVGRLQRLARMARVGTRTGASLLFSRSGKGAAEQAATVLGSMRGLAAKLGQMASYVDGFVPAAQQEAFEAALKNLRDATPESPPEAVRRVIESDLGKPVSELFASFEEKPFASASIGQVHRAVLHSGEQVAVKVQHPGVDEAIENDLKNAGMIKQLAATLATDDFNADALFKEVAARFREELDYRLEAKHQQHFTAFAHDEPRVHIPRVFEELSARRVLTSEYATGISLEEAVKQSEDVRRTYAEVLWYFAFRSILVDGVFNADPHPGNYLFQPDGRVTFLDFGCVQELSEDVLAYSRAAHLAALRGDESDFACAVVQLGNTDGGPYEEAFQRYLHKCLEPVFRSPFRITREFVTDLVQEIFELKKLALSRKSRMVAVPESTVLLNRLQFGFMSVVARLDVDVDYASIERRFFQQAGIIHVD